MRRRGVFLLSAAVAVAVVACSADIDEESRSPGERAFRASCQTCHALPEPSVKTDEEWPALVARYGARARLTTEQIAAITAYLVAANSD